MEPAQFEVRVDAAMEMRFVPRPDGGPVSEVIASYSNGAELHELLLAKPHRVSPKVEDRIKEHEYMYHHPEGKFLWRLGACCCCVMPCCADQTQAWDMDRDTDEVRKQVVALLAPHLQPADYALYESSGVWQSDERTFDPASGGLCVLRLYLNARPPAQGVPAGQGNLL